MQRSFQQLIGERALYGFMGEVADYYRHYGSWKAALAGETLGEFTLRTRPGVMRPQMPAPPQDRGSAPPLPSEGFGNPERSDPATRLPLPRRQLELGRIAPGIAVSDMNGITVVPSSDLALGQVWSAKQLEKGTPVLVDGYRVGTALVQEQPPMSAIDEGYYEAVNQSWLYSLILAVTLAVPIGIVLSRHFTDPILSLQKAMVAIKNGQLGDVVPVQSRDELGQLALAFNRMSEELATTHAQLRDLSLLDDLTQLPNRRAFNEQSHSLLAQSRRMAYPMVVAIADADYFKRINDDFSHSIGDRVLQELACLMRGSIREVDIIARWGGEEFVFLFPQTELHNAVLLCDKLRQQVQAHPWAEIAEGMQVSISFGLAEHTHERSLDDSIAAADERLYAAKNEGRNRVCS